MLNVCRNLFVGIVGGGLLIGGIAWGRSLYAGNQMMAILHGSESVRVTEFRIGKSVICRDRALCEYITKMLRGAKTGSSPGGVRISYSFCFSSGVVYTVENGFLIEDGFAPSIPEANPLELGLETHRISFPTPIPQRIRTIWNAFLKGDPEVKRGWTMVIEEGGELRWEYNPQLDREGMNANWRAGRQEEI
ncbi:MAG: hypothetical protein KDA68_02955 [Planctomycetaceae bacterium]|nr:hypothetical protein [Planctomycetaceae bacterium]